MNRNPRRAVRAPRIMSKYYHAILDLLIARGFNGAARAGAPEQGRKLRHPPPLRFDLMQNTAHIIGAGISGLSAAVRLANAGYKVAVSTRRRSRPAAAAAPISTARPIS